MRDQPGVVDASPARGQLKKLFFPMSPFVPEGLIALLLHNQPNLVLTYGTPAFRYGTEVRQVMQLCTNSIHLREFAYTGLAVLKEVRSTGAPYSGNPNYIHYWYSSSKRVGRRVYCIWGETDSAHAGIDKASHVNADPPVRFSLGDDTSTTNATTTHQVEGEKSCRWLRRESCAQHGVTEAHPCSPLGR